METEGRTPSPDKSDTRPSFRKPLNEAVNRKYRRHFPGGGGGSDSSPSHGSPKRERSHSPPVSKEVHSKLTGGQHGKDIDRQTDRDVSRSHSNRGHDPQRYTERQSYRSSYDSRRDDDHGRHHRHFDDERHQRSYRLGREVRNDDNFEYSQNDRISDRSRDSWRTNSSRSENVDSRSSRNSGREHLSKDHHKVDERGRQANPNRGSEKTDDRDYPRDNEYSDDRKDYSRNRGDRKNDCRDEEVRGYRKGSSRGRESGTLHLKETDNIINKDYVQEDQIQKRKCNEWESRSKDKYPMKQEEERCAEKKSLFDYRENDEKNQRVDKISNWSDRPNPSSTTFKFASGNVADEKPSFNQQDKEVEEKANANAMSSTNNEAEGANNVDAAKVAALKAAELVNRNLVGAGGVGYLSTDQKKKLLWGSKKNNAAEESSSHWDLNLFSDKERQDKFNKLMGVKGVAVPEAKSEQKDGGLQAKKREELEMDLEKQYTAGLRRRDGRTVGLGL